jgi:hypothetical protein
MRKDRTGVDDAAMIICILPRLAVTADGISWLIFHCCSGNENRGTDLV